MRRNKLKSLLMRMKEESEKDGLKLHIKKKKKCNEILILICNNES